MNKIVLFLTVFGCLFFCGGTEGPPSRFIECACRPNADPRETCCTAVPKKSDLIPAAAFSACKTLLPTPPSSVSSVNASTGNSSASATSSATSTINNSVNSAKLPSPKRPPDGLFACYAECILNQTRLVQNGKIDMTKVPDSWKPSVANCAKAYESPYSGEKKCPPNAMKFKKCLCDSTTSIFKSCPSDKMSTTDVCKKAKDDLSKCT